MIIVKIMGGLGNQMFQYAYAKFLKNSGYDVKLGVDNFYQKQNNHNYGLDFYNIDIPNADQSEIKKFYKYGFSNRLYRRLLRTLNIKPKYVKGHIQEKTLEFDKNLTQPHNGCYIVGYFQNENYFKEVKSLILDSFTLKEKISDYSTKILKEIKNSELSCSIHIRRGDYLNKGVLEYHGLCSLEYYLKAVGKIKNLNKNTKFFIFSDDVAWVKENLKIENAVYIEFEQERVPHEDIFLMSQCNHNIIANSSFSWWGAYLNQNVEKMVIAPKRWFADKTLNSQASGIVCYNWIKI